MALPYLPLTLTTRLMKAFITLLALAASACAPSSSDSPPPADPTQGTVILDETFDLEPPCDEVDLLLWDVTNFRGNLRPYSGPFRTALDKDFLLIPIEPGEEYSVTIFLRGFPWIQTVTNAHFGTGPGLGSCFQTASDPEFLLSSLRSDPASGTLSAWFVAPEAPVAGEELYLFIEISGELFEPGLSEPWVVSVQRM